jgi:hypothetical protein
LNGSKTGKAKITETTALKIQLITQAEALVEEDQLVLFQSLMAMTMTTKLMLRTTIEERR